MSIISALNDPLPVFLADNFTDVMTPDHDRPDSWTAGIGAEVGPRSREIVLRAGIAADQLTHVPATPSPGTAAYMRMPRGS